jgi:SAM-dependent methyltransferase
VRDRDDWEEGWRELGDVSAVNPARKYRDQLILSVLASESAAPRIIDFGSGQGDLALALARALPRAQIVGIERARSGVERARIKVPGVRFLQHDLRSDPDTPETASLRGWADVGTCTEVIEHLDDPGAMLRRLRGYLRPGGRLIVTVPGGPMSGFDRAIGHRRHYSPLELRAELERGGYRVETLHAAGFPFFNLYKLVVVARGDAVMRDASAGRDDLVARAAYATFRWLFRANLASTPWGWQMLVVARV